MQGRFVSDDEGAPKGDRVRRMWLFTTRGFYSVVEDRDDPDRLLVRARVREDLEALREQIPELDPQETSDADCRWRAWVTRDQWVEAAARLAGEIDYPNFKSAVGARQGSERERTYSRIWAELLELQREDSRSDSL